jgi:hypothetical protein
MPIRCAAAVVAVSMALLAGGCSCEAKRGPEPQPPGTEQVAVPGVPGPAAPEAMSRKRPPPSDRPLLPEEGELAIEVPATTPGVETTARLRLTAHHGYEINEKFHYKLTLEPTPGVTLPKTVFTEAAHDAERLDAHELAIAMKLTADKTGDYTVHGSLSFAVCKVDSQCLPKSMAITVQVAAR